jgi:hypothetical protein
MKPTSVFAAATLFGTGLWVSMVGCRGCPQTACAQEKQPLAQNASQPGSSDIPLREQFTEAFEQAQEEYRWFAFLNTVYYATRDDYDWKTRYPTFMNNNNPKQSDNIKMSDFALAVLLRADAALRFANEDITEDNLKKIRSDLQVAKSFRLQVCRKILKDVFQNEFGIKYFQESALKQ